MSLALLILAQAVEDHSSTRERGRGRGGPPVSITTTNGRGEGARKGASETAICMSKEYDELKLLQGGTKVKRGAAREGEDEGEKERNTDPDDSSATSKVISDRPPFAPPSMK